MAGYAPFVHCSIITPNTPTRRSRNRTERTICTAETALFAVRKNRPSPDPWMGGATAPIGRPQWGQAGARVDTSRSQSGQETVGMTLCSYTVNGSTLNRNPAHSIPFWDNPVLGCSWRADACRPTRLPTESSSCA